jgi:hypothetical protein
MTEKLRKLEPNTPLRRDNGSGTQRRGWRFSSQMNWRTAMAKSQTSSKSARKPRKPTRTTPRRWSATVTETSDAMDLEKNVFKSESPKHIAASVKRSAERSRRRKSSPFRSAMSMLNFYINRAGQNLSASHRRVLEAAKDQLRRLFHRPAVR